jgi:hypothetical protein
MSTFLYSQLRSFHFVVLIAHRQQKTLLTRGKQGLEILWILYYLLTSGLSNVGS